MLIHVIYSGGLQTIGFLSEVFGPIILFALFIMIALIVKEFHVGNISPNYYDSGLSAIFKASLHPLSFLAEFVIMLALIYFTNPDDSHNVMKGAMGGVALSTIFSCIVLMAVLFTFGPNISADMLYPAFDMVSYIFVMDFIQNMEILAGLVSMLSIFIKLSLYYFVVCHLISNIHQTEHLMKVALFVAPVIFNFAVSIPNISTVLYSVNILWNYFALPKLMVGIPLLFYMIITLKNIYGRNN